ncbi:THUMP domain-containing protein 2-like [Littorina saxatilis]|uniref:Ribosomal RNA large subunit methyltransferase K/L-like methyltransferase domain-containing protein n=1 Tax=Littorina saxatilis TaxID=31220 RepID=A0AAN9BIX4_9CAEN
MQVHATCGRGTELFAKEELLSKLKCQTVQVQDGKVFSTIEYSNSASAASASNLFDLRTAERIFTTVTHFPTSEIKAPGDKVKFLRALKKRILDRSSLERAVRHTRELRKVRKEKQSHETGETRHNQQKNFHFSTEPESYSERKKQADHPSKNSLIKRQFPDNACEQDVEIQQTSDTEYCPGEVPEKRPRLDSTPFLSSCESEEGKVCGDDKTEGTNSIPSPGQGTGTPTFRFSAKCRGSCRKWLQPQRLCREMAVTLTSTTQWEVNLQHPEMEICVHLNDDFVTVGIPLTREPISERKYILNSGLRSPVCYIMASLANIEPGHCVLDPMCGKATILVEAAKEYSQGVAFIGCDKDSDQLKAGSGNVDFAGLNNHIQLIQADALNMPLKASTVNRIVCDAPFGQKFKVNSPDLQEFYKHLLQEMYRLLVSGGLAVLLTSQELVPVVTQYTHKSPHTSDDTGSSAHQSSKTDTPKPCNRAFADQHTKDDLTSTAHDDLTSTAKDNLTSTASKSAETCDAGGNGTEENGTSKTDLSSVNEAAEETETDTEQDRTQFYCLSTHYLKLGETHAFLMVLQKPEDVKEV